MPPLIKFNDKATDAVMAQVEKRLAVAAQYLRTQIVKNISIPTRTEGPSKPGEMPHADTGRLRQSIFVADGPDPLSKIVGTNVDYGIIHETGERPFMRPTAIQCQAMLTKIVGTPVSTNLVVSDEE